MSSMRLDIEKAMGLKFPEKNGEVIVRFEESVEIPQPAEMLMRGLYRDPERVRQGFKLLQQETGSIIEILMPRRSRLREWAESLPDRPKEAESFLKETAEQFFVREQHLVQAERELVGQLQESGLDDIYPIPLAAFGVCTYRDPSVKLYLKPLGRFAEINEMNPESLRKVVRIHFLFMLLLISGADLDGQVYARGEEDKVIHWLTSTYTLRYLKNQSAELIHCYQEWVNAWGGKMPSQSMLNDRECEKTRAAMIFWRRQTNISWDECWRIVSQFERANSTNSMIF
ncbi:hypothetical protein Desor_3449 [Desulfosporosinus orientis DSM 765]|uniref:Uncharacterized protein n=1 Tax=Desulfosporosinus orientis (strain ATCC 19365 / DSM 765 / NCIMB 8382 / VKM B-1628 / Singapore I) TaxID=768706 RepID=G7WFS1_DESOD|nr:hypothetical protein [Desulfosporosinus orientis]AET68944.1 hypothetical protein Desor_3449 [Desulfosporosinus orientis DSM 765]